MIYTSSEEVRIKLAERSKGPYFGERGMLNRVGGKGHCHGVGRGSERNKGKRY